jgi:glutamate-ammonia-ligase adenylyltransferase
MFVSAARDVIEARPVFASLMDSTNAAEEAISTAFAMSNVNGLAVMALGRLGTHEFDCLSDADLLFVRDRTLPADEAIRVAENLMHSLSAYTNEGTVLAVDVRLRPHGNDGELTITPEQLAAYLREEAQPWEALTYTKVRYVAGDAMVSKRALAAIEGMHNRFLNSDGFMNEIREMRKKLERSDDSGNFKTGHGGLYDIDFLVGSLLLRKGIRTAAEGNMRQRLQKVGQAGFIGKDNLQILLDGLDFWRTLEHVTRLSTGRAQRSLPVSESARRSLEEMVARIYSPQVAARLDDHVQRTREAVHTVFDRIVR